MAWNRMLADIMQANTGTCNDGSYCFVEVGLQTHVIKLGETFVDGCTVYTCTVILVTKLAGLKSL